MSTSKHIDKICCIILIATLTLTLLFMNAGRFGVQAVSASVSAAGYVSRIFNPSKVHTVDIVMDDWDTFIENCTDEEYAACAVIIDGEAYRNVAIRAKGNTSLSSVEAMETADTASKLNSTIMMMHSLITGLINYASIISSRTILI